MILRTPQTPMSPEATRNKLVGSGKEIPFEPPFKSPVTAKTKAGARYRELKESAQISRFCIKLYPLSFYPINNYYFLIS